MDSYCHHLVNIPRNETRHTTLHFLDQLERAILTQICWCHVYNVLSFAGCWREKEKLIKISYLSRNSKQSTFRLLILQYLLNSFTETRRYYIRQGAEYNWETWSTLPPTPQSSEWYRSFGLSDQSTIHFLSSLMRATYLAHLILYLIFLMTFGDDNKLWNSSLCRFLHFSVTLHYKNNVTFTEN
jgi:hypothetical protein